MNNPQQQTIPYEETRFGFNYGSLVIERICSDETKGSVTIYLRTPKRHLELCATKTGRLRLFDSDDGGREIKL